MALANRRKSLYNASKLTNIKGKKRGLVIVCCILVTTIFLCLFTTFGFSIVRISGDSMLPTLHHDEWVVISKYDTWLRSASINYERGDIVYFHYPSSKKRTRFIYTGFSDDLLLAKRVLAVAGESIKIEKGHVFINGEPLAEPYIENLGGFSMPEKHVLEGQVFVLGDNRIPLGSVDSRHFGAILERSILGRVWPLT